MSSTGQGPGAEARTFLETLHPGAATVALGEEASGRRYHRVVGTGSVLMVRPDPFLERDDPYCCATELLEACGVRVPRILAADGRRGLLLLEDCGDDLLAGVLGALDRDEVARRYALALDVLERLARGTRLLHPGRPAGRERLGPARLEWELLFFHRHWVEGMRRAALDPGEGASLRAFYRRLAREVWEARTPVLCHRDFHARNLLWCEDRGGPVTLDHQDARWGPGLYDLTSLLRDPYVGLPEGLEEAMREEWARRTGTRAGEWADAFERTALQRNLKAAGTYACQVVLFGREIFRRSLAPTLAHARTALRGLPDCSGILRLLDAHRLLEA